MADFNSIQPVEGYFYEGPEMYRLIVTVDGKELLWNRIGQFSYTNMVNQLYITGRLEYNDDDGIISRLTDKQDCECVVNIEHYKCEKEGDLGEPKVDSIVELCFKIDLIERPSKDSNFSVVHLKGNSYYNSFKNVNFSSYGDPKRPVDIINDILSYRESFKTDGKSFQDSVDDMSIEFITNENDRICDVVHRMLQKTLNPPLYATTGNTLKVLVYDDRIDTVSIVDIGRKQNTGKHTPVVVNTFKNKKDEPEVFKYINGQDNTIGYVNDISRTKSILNMISRKTISYNIMTNSFTFGETEQKTNNNTVNGINNKNPKYVSVLNGDFYNNVMQWKDSEDLYDKLYETIIGSSGISVNTIGNIGSIAGWSCEVIIAKPTRSADKLSQENKEYDNMLFQYFSGDWFISRVDHIMSPTGNYFRDRLDLCRVEKEY